MADSIFFLGPRLADIVLPQSIRDDIQHHILLKIRYEAPFLRAGQEWGQDDAKNFPIGVILSGLPGVCKTVIATAIGVETKATMYIVGSHCTDNSYVGESET